MNQPPKNDSLQPISSNDDEQPEVYGLIKQGNGFALDRRTFLGGLVAAGALASTTSIVAETQQDTEVEGQACVNTKLKGHLKDVNAVAITPDSALLISGKFCRVRIAYHNVAFS